MKIINQVDELIALEHPNIQICIRAIKKINNINILEYLIVSDIDVDIVENACLKLQEINPYHPAIRYLIDIRKNKERFILPICLTCLRQLIPDRVVSTCKICRSIHDNRRCEDMSCHECEYHHICEKENVKRKNKN